MKRFSLLCLCLLQLTMVGHGWAGGFYAPEIASPGSIGSAGAANPTNIYDASAAVTNPTGMLYLKDDTVSRIGIQALVPVLRFDSDDSTTVNGSDAGNSGTATVIPGVFVAQRVSPELSVGAAISAKMGGGVEYDDDFVGRYQSLLAEFNGVGITASAAYRLDRRWSVGAGVTMIYNRLDVDTAVNRCLILMLANCTPNVTVADGKVRFDKLEGWSPQYTFNVMYELSDDWTLGLVYRSKAELELKGQLKASDNLNGTPIEAQQGTLKLEFDAPEVFEIGLRHHINPALVLFLEADWERFSQFSNNTLYINDGSVDQRDRDWDDTWRVSAGLAKITADGIIGAGIGYDSSPVSDSKRTFDIPVDEQLRLAFAWESSRQDFSYSLAAEYIWLGTGKIRQESPFVQGLRVDGEFSTNFLLVLSASAEYRF